ncbi:hypothetical protein BV898_13493 [Hypsibius exemplaris]|uniref:Uncharacterized protein n=1 Tax=Hypsibius exemplaris TaxID=2072580 RepID=A0A1W0WAL0_HYPEX|nr:hypothetical protein BV898_13493 [Hypsibius exemplaris]
MDQLCRHDGGLIADHPVQPVGNRNGTVEVILLPDPAPGEKAYFLSTPDGLFRVTERPSFAGIAAYDANCYPLDPRIRQRIPGTTQPVNVPVEFIPLPGEPTDPLPLLIVTEPSIALGSKVFSIGEPDNATDQLMDGSGNSWTSGTASNTAESAPPPIAPWDEVLAKRRKADALNKISSNGHADSKVTGDTGSFFRRALGKDDSGSSSPRTASRTLTEKLRNFSSEGPVSHRQFVVDEAAPFRRSYGEHSRKKDRFPSRTGYTATRDGGRLSRTPSRERRRRHVRSSSSPESSSRETRKGSRSLERTQHRRTASRKRRRDRSSSPESLKFVRRRGSEGLTASSTSTSKKKKKSSRGRSRSRSPEPEPEPSKEPKLPKKAPRKSSTDEGCISQRVVRRKMSPTTSATEKYVGGIGAVPAYAATETIKLTENEVVQFNLFMAHKTHVDLSGVANRIERQLRVDEPENVAGEAGSSKPATKLDMLDASVNDPKSKESSSALSVTSDTDRVPLTAVFDRSNEQRIRNSGQKKVKSLQIRIKSKEEALQDRFSSWTESRLTADLLQECVTAVEPSLYLTDISHFQQKFTRWRKDCQTSLRYMEFFLDQSTSLLDRAVLQKGIGTMFIGYLNLLKHDPGSAALAVGPKSCECQVRISDEESQILKILDDDRIKFLLSRESIVACKAVVVGPDGREAACLREADKAAFYYPKSSPVLLCLEHMCPCGIFWDSEGVGGGGCRFRHFYHSNCFPAGCPHGPCVEELEPMPLPHRGKLIIDDN